MFSEVNSSAGLNDGQTRFVALCGTCWNVFTACPGMEGRFWRGSSKPCQGACPRSGDLQVGLDRVCARATLPLSGQAGVLKTDSETYAAALPLTLGDFRLRRDHLVGFDLGYMRALLRYIVTERRWQLPCSAPRFVVFEPVQSHTRLLLLDQVDDSVEHL